MAAAGNLMIDNAMQPSLDLDGLNLIVGLGASGVSAARFINARGGELRIIDSRSAPPGLGELSDIRAEVITESLDAGFLDDVARVVLSPGLSIDLPFCQAARERGIEILNDIEIFARACNAPVIAVTGSNGKSTVVSLLESMLQAADIDAFAGGNLGPPALDLLERAADVYVLEISSFQMEVAESLAPLAATVLNVSADHLDRHPDVATYAGLKEKLLRNAQSIVINADDPRVRAMGQRWTGKPTNRIEFSIEQQLQHGYSIINDALAVDGEPLVPLSQLVLPGRHNAANALAALALARTCTAAPAPMLDALRSFSGLAHRCEYVAEVAGVTYINDSKGTNPGATAAALNGLPGPIVLIAGGVGKGADFSQLRDGVRDKLRSAVLIGEAASQIDAAIGDMCPVIHAGSMRAAVTQAAAAAQTGDTVLLSPACASFDMFADYVDRGRSFKDAVKALS